MRVLLMSFLAVSCAAAAAQSPPTSVTYELSGAMSGPYKLSADLVQGTASEAKPPPGDFPGTAAARSDPPVTASASLSPGEIRAIQQAAATVWRYGASKDDEHYWPPNDPGPAYRKWQRDTDNGKKPGSYVAPPIEVHPPQFCYGGIDAVASFEIVKNGKTKTRGVSAQCMNRDAKRLFLLMACKFHPDEGRCPKL